MWKKEREGKCVYIYIHYIYTTMYIYCYILPLYVCVCVYIYIYGRKKLREGKCISPRVSWVFPGGTSGKESACQFWRCKRLRFSPWVGKIP